VSLFRNLSSSGVTPRAFSHAFCSAARILSSVFLSLPARLVGGLGVVREILPGLSLLSFSFVPSSG